MMERLSIVTLGQRLRKYNRFGPRHRPPCREALRQAKGKGFAVVKNTDEWCRAGADAPEGRYRAIRILDEPTLLACSAYVDLNPIRTAMAETIEQSDFTSAQRRIESIQIVSLCVARHDANQDIAFPQT